MLVELNASILVHCTLSYTNEEGAGTAFVDALFVSFTSNTLIRLFLLAGCNGVICRTCRNNWESLQIKNHGDLPTLEGSEIKSSPDRQCLLRTAVTIAAVKCTNNGTLASNIALLDRVDATLTTLIERTLLRLNASLSSSLVTHTRLHPLCYPHLGATTLFKYTL